MKEKNVSHEEAVRRIGQIESRRASYYNYYTGKKWGHAESYDLCIDSSVLGISATARFIAAYIRDVLKLKSQSSDFEENRHTE